MNIEIICKTILTGFAIIAVTLIILFSITHNVDGATIVGGGVAAIAGLGGYQLNAIIKAVKAKKTE